MMIAHTIGLRGVLLAVALVLYVLCSLAPGCESRIEVIPPHSNQSELTIEDLQPVTYATPPSEGALGRLVIANPLNACTPISPAPYPVNDSFLWFLLAERGICSVTIKLYHAERAGFSGLIIFNDLDPDDVLLTPDESDIVEAVSINMAIKPNEAGTDAQPVSVPLVSLPEENTPINLQKTPSHSASRIHRQGRQLLSRLLLGQQHKSVDQISVPLTREPTTLRSMSSFIQRVVRGNALAKNGHVLGGAHDDQLRQPETHASQSASSFVLSSGAVLNNRFALERHGAASNSKLAATSHNTNNEKTVHSPSHTRLSNILNGKNHVLSNNTYQRQLIQHSTLNRNNDSARVNQSKRGNLLSVDSLTNFNSSANKHSNAATVIQLAINLPGSASNQERATRLRTPISVTVAEQRPQNVGSVIKNTTKSENATEAKIRLRRSAFYREASVDSVPNGVGMILPGNNSRWMSLASSVPSARLSYYHVANETLGSTKKRLIQGKQNSFDPSGVYPKWQSHIYAVIISRASGRILQGCDWKQGYILHWYPGAGPVPVLAFLFPLIFVVLFCSILIACFFGCQQCRRWYRGRRRLAKYRLARKYLRQLPIRRWTSPGNSKEGNLAEGIGNGVGNGENYDGDLCSICLEDYVDGDRLRVLPCQHAYHAKCIDRWLTKTWRVCPLCKRKIRLPGMSDNDLSDDEGGQPNSNGTTTTTGAVSEDNGGPASQNETSPLLFRSPEGGSRPAFRGRGSTRIHDHEIYRQRLLRIMRALGTNLVHAEVHNTDDAPADPEAGPSRVTSDGPSSAPQPGAVGQRAPLSALHHGRHENQSFAAGRRLSVGADLAPPAGTLTRSASVGAGCRRKTPRKRLFGRAVQAPFDDVSVGSNVGTASAHCLDGDVSRTPFTATAAACPEATVGAVGSLPQSGVEQAPANASTSALNDQVAARTMFSSLAPLSFFLSRTGVTSRSPPAASPTDDARGPVSKSTEGRGRGHNAVVPRAARGRRRRDRRTIRVTEPSTGDSRRGSEGPGGLGHADSDDDDDERLLIA